uniref:RxLR effector protein n=1 Tax=Panagrellus redivivus TaxID=6233 RepID=A0A7E4W643_PANRE
MQTGTILLFVAVYISCEVVVNAFEYDLAANSHNFAPNNDYVRNVGTRRDLSLRGAAGRIERPSAPRRLIQPPPLKRSVPLMTSEQMDDVYRWLAFYNQPALAEI